MATVYASGGRPDACRYGHRWDGKGSMTVGWMPCDCPQAQQQSPNGHHWIRCLAPGCPSIWYDPPHES